MGEALCCIPLDRSTVAVTKHFGRFNDILEPGFHCLPFSLGYQLAGSSVHYSVYRSEIVQTLIVDIAPDVHDISTHIGEGLLQAESIHKQTWDVFPLLSNVESFPIVAPD
ncbi:Hypersensitive-induced response protein 2 [Sesamum angolense]|uniref:Hypersensitive-induced response protein 2 n=1 Tax=Sesamum angolense TaxID=2727404 RepID=A0AAE1WWZ1_9LAMI|nr:Hypersensitive-induced response protein 2 [Sesamum angolense]